MEWNVYYYDINRGEIRPFNIFHNIVFKGDVDKILKKCKNKETFEKELKSCLMYTYWCRAEYEVIISPWCGGNDKDGMKVDIYSQVMLNWDKFVDYVWNYRD